MKNQRVLITGGNRGLGRALTQAFVDAGATVAISSRSGDPVEGAQAFAADFSDLTQVDQLFHNATAHLGGIDVLINNAAGYFRSPLDDLDTGTFELLFRTNVIAPIRLMQLAAQQMSPDSSIINISSVSGTTASPNGTPNCTTKAALNMATRTAALEWGPRGIRCNAIEPGMLDVESNLSFKESQPADWAAQLQLIPLRRATTAEETAALALFLASPAASGIHGTIIRCDSGQAT